MKLNALLMFIAFIMLSCPAGNRWHSMPSENLHLTTRINISEYDHGWDQSAYVEVNGYNGSNIEIYKAEVKILCEGRDPSLQELVFDKVEYGPIAETYVLYLGAKPKSSFRATEEILYRKGVSKCDSILYKVYY